MIGLKCKDGVVLVVEKMLISKMLVQGIARTNCWASAAHAMRGSKKKTGYPAAWLRGVASH